MAALPNTPMELTFWCEFLFIILALNANEFGLAANIAQFVNFTTQLISKSKEIYNSADGVSNEISTLQWTYRQLQDLGQKLETSSPRDPAPNHVPGTDSEYAKRVSAISDLSRCCKDDCNRLLEVLRELTENGKTNSRWQSFRSALKTIWKAKEIASLERRLHNIQTSLTLEMCALTR